MLVFDKPPDGLTRIERVLWPSLGLACARGALWLSAWLTLGRYKQACSWVGVTTPDIAMMRTASPLYNALYERVDSLVRVNRQAECEDTLHDLATGEMTLKKQALTRKGDIVELSAQVQSDKALALALAAGDPTRYGGGKPGAGSGGPSVIINIQAPRPEDYAVKVDVKPADPTASEPEDIEAEVIEG